jgi:glycosyltransferase involved in cell wall biosynthesis
MNNPVIVSVVMPVFNTEKYLRFSIESILNQTFTNFEFIIINDGSTDTSREIITSYKDSRIRLVDNEINIGLTKSLNKGIDLASGIFIARMDSDDICLPTRFEKQVDFLYKNEKVDVVGSWFEKFGYYHELIKLPKSNEEIVLKLLLYTTLAHPCVMMRKVIFERYQYKESNMGAEDYDLWVRMSKNVTFANLQEILLKYRTHATQISKVSYTTQKQTFNEFRSSHFNFIYNLITDNEDITFNLIPYTLLTYNHLKDFEKKVELMILLNNQKKKYIKELLIDVLIKLYANLFAFHQNINLSLFMYFCKSPLKKHFNFGLLFYLKFGLMSLLRKPFKPQFHRNNK